MNPRPRMARHLCGCAVILESEDEMTDRGEGQQFGEPRTVPPHRWLRSTRVEVGW
jgi:hypothetical protein